MTRGRRARPEEHPVPGITERAPGQRLIQALEDQGDDFVGPQLAPFRYSADSHLGIAGVRVVQAENGSLKDLTPVLVTDTGDTDITEDSSGQGDDAPPSSGIPDAG